MTSKSQRFLNQHSTYHNREKMKTVDLIKKFPCKVKRQVTHREKVGLMHLSNKGLGDENVENS